MDLTPSNLNAFFQNVRLDYQKGYMDAPTFAEKVATTIPSTSAANIFAWMDFLPKMRQWVGERVVQNAVARSMLITNLDFESTVEVPRNTLKDDQYGIYAPMMQMLGREAKLWPEEQVANAIINGGTAATATTYDGVAFFSASHPIDASGNVAGVQSNDLTLALTPANFATAVATAKSYRGRDGLPMGTFARGQLILMVGPSLEKTARDIVTTQFLSPTAGWGAAAASAPSANPYMGVAEVLVNPYITSSTAWYLFDVSMPIKPLIWQLREAPRFTQRTADSDDPVFERNVYQYGVNSRGAASYGPWFLAVRGNV